MEEVGLDVTVCELAGVYWRPDKADLVLCFLCDIVGGTQRLPHEADDIGFFALDDLPATTLPRHVERIGDAPVASGTPLLRVQRGA